MAPAARRTARAPAKLSADEVTQVALTNGNGNGTAAKRGRAKQIEATKVEKLNGTAAKAVKPEVASRTSRPKKSATPPAAPKPTQKRKKSEEVEDAPEPKPKKTKVIKDVKPKDNTPQPKGPRRPAGRKTEINAIRYTEPLKVFVFGEGGNGELGLGASKKSKDVKRPRFNERLSNMDVVKVAAGGMHVVALTKDNKIVTWGVNDNGALGRETPIATVAMKDADADSDSDDDDETGGLNDVEATPTAISAEHFPPDTIFVDVAAGDSCSFALTTEGAVYGWGTFRKNEGVLGFTRGINTARTPIYIEDVKKVTYIACGTNHVMALDVNKHVFAWGNGQQNQLGRRVTERSLIEALLPNRVGFHDKSFKRPSQKIVKISCGDYHSLAIGEDGHVWAWGANNYCETAIPANAGEDSASILAPQIIKSLENLQVVSVEGGSHHNVAITAKGECLAWGRCDGHQTGIPMSELSAIDDDSKVLKSNDKPKILVTPTTVPNLDNIVTVACGPEHTIAINKEGKAFSWGFSTNYQTGQGTFDDIEVPTLIDNTAVREIKLTMAGAGGQYSVLGSKK
ncbi:RCC1/BLIP-II [Pleomassaria siparia CBS 279.74]|uniref:RCC1/BLIP-II n=1 Tax=Pleomassaria siparia CBS 279.74 TaxID=1314801 RepID=A0A6G1KIU4_9PLEO|nr:RCC1/BLIP-II [Pleomassaria siparia CBS 279.74]